MHDVRTMPVSEHQMGLGTQQSAKTAIDRPPARPAAWAGNLTSLACTLRAFGNPGDLTHLQPDSLLPPGIGF